MFQDLKHMALHSKTQEQYLRTGTTGKGSETFLFTHSLVTCAGWIYPVSTIRQKQDSTTPKNKALVKDKIRLPSRFAHGPTPDSASCNEGIHPGEAHVSVFDASSQNSCFYTNQTPGNSRPSAPPCTRVGGFSSLVSLYVPEQGGVLTHPAISGRQVEMCYLRRLRLSPILPGPFP